jgi:7-cyano-7-deazaguanine synthase
MEQKAVVLLSGGLDSTTVLAQALSQNYHCVALSFDYGQRHDAELKAAKKIAQTFGVRHEVVSLSIGQFGQSALTDASLEVPDYTGSSDIPITYVPARNTVFLSIALSLAESLAANAIFIGVSAIDYSHYPDCRPEFIEAFNALICKATKQTAEGGTIEIKAPLIKLSKAETVQLGHDLGVDYSHTVSCYQLTQDGKACGKCDSCTLRKKGFLEANLADPTIYV